MEILHINAKKWGQYVCPFLESINRILCSNKKKKTIESYNNMDET